MSANDNLQLIISALQLWVKREKENSISETGLELLQGDIDIAFQYLNKTPDVKGHFDDCCWSNRLCKTGPDTCTCCRLNCALFRMKNLDEFYK